MRSTRYDILIHTGAAWSCDVECYAPGDPIPAGTLAPGRRVFVEGLPLLVASVAPRGAGRVVVTFGQGLWNTPSMMFLTDALVSPADPVLLTDAVAAYHVMDPDMPNVTIPATLSPDGLSVHLSLDPDVTAAMDTLGGAHSWDCYVCTDEWDWQRVLEGTMTIIRGDAR